MNDLLPPSVPTLAPLLKELLVVRGLVESRVEDTAQLFYSDESKLIAHNDHVRTLLAIDEILATLPELRAILDNERGEGTPPGKGWIWDHGNQGWTLEGSDDLDDIFYDEVIKPHDRFCIDWRWAIHEFGGKELKTGLTPTARAGMREAIAARLALPRNA